ncbi:hypothetical protein D3C81_2002790 [compost metagenome]
MLGNPGQDSINLFNGCRVFGFRREAVFREYDCSASTGCQFPDQPVMGVAVAEDPTRTMDIQNDRQSFT